jgi:hypothetical protein
VSRARQIVTQAELRRLLQEQRVSKAKAGWEQVQWELVNDFTSDQDFKERIKVVHAR